ncbi:MAG: glycosyltransferase family 4 protein [Thaumarchaeota archaeon]|nr:glycosyltransferase family 4 protein [Nitrososphaerota archaeon]
MAKADLTGLPRRGRSNASKSRETLTQLGVMMLSWEFPPRVIGGIAPHTDNLSRSLARKGNTVYIVTCDYPGAPEYEEVDGIKVHRVNSYKFPTPDFATWVSMMNVNLGIKAAEIVKSNKNRIQILHAHDWLVANASIGLKHLFRIPLIATIHSTEYGRRGGIYDDYQRMISSTEGWLAREAWRIICCSGYMASEISSNLSAPNSKIDVIPNGVNLQEFRGEYDKKAFRAKFALPNERLVLFVGRLVHEKGARILVEAIPHVLKTVDAKFVIVGEGYLREQLLAKTNEMGVSHKTLISGFLDTPTVKSLFRTADVCVVPSLYEPFGIVALEAIAAKTPLVTTGTGGLGEIVQHDRHAVLVHPSAQSVAWGITKILTDPAYAERLTQAAYQRALSSYKWDNIAAKTLKVYSRVMNEYDASTWKPRKQDDYRAR